MGFGSPLDVMSHWGGGESLGLPSGARAQPPVFLGAAKATGTGGPGHAGSRDQTPVHQFPFMPVRQGKSHQGPSSTHAPVAAFCPSPSLWADVGPANPAHGILQRHQPARSAALHRCLYPFISSPFCVSAGGRPSAGTGQASGRCWPCCGRGFAPRSAPRVKPSSR